LSIKKLKKIKNLPVFNKNEMTRKNKSMVKEEKAHSYGLADLVRESSVPHTFQGARNPLFFRQNRVLQRKRFRLFLHNSA